MFEIKFTEQQINLVLQALQELPYRVSRELIDSIIAQARDQATPAESSLPDNVDVEVELPEGDE